MPKLKIKKGDNVVVISGRDKGRTGEVLRVFPAESRLIVQGVHVASGIPSRAWASPAASSTRS